MVEQFSRNCLDKIRHADIMMDRWTETGGVYLHKKANKHTKPITITVWCFQHIMIVQCADNRAYWNYWKVFAPTHLSIETVLSFCVCPFWHLSIPQIFNLQVCFSCTKAVISAEKVNLYKIWFVCFKSWKLEICGFRKIVFLSEFLSFFFLF